jgi:hypothetical protein
LEAGAATPDKLTVRLIFPDGGGHDFTVKTVKLLDYGVDELAGRGFTPLLPFYILKLRKAAKRAKSDAEKREVEEGFKELGLELKKAIEAGGGNISEEDRATLLERLYWLNRPLICLYPIAPCLCWPGLAAYHSGTRRNPEPC